MRLNRGLSCLLFLGVLAFSGCSDDKWEGLKVFDGTFFEIGSEGEQLRIPIRSSSEWVVTGNWGKWCEIRQESGEKVYTLVLDVGVNIARQERGMSLELSNREETLEIELRQAAATEEYEYVLPVIFHVLYRVPEDDVPVGYLSSCLERVNELYRDGPVDMNLKFVLATHDPNGQLLEEPGVRREFREGLPMDMFDFVGNKFGDCAWIWDPKEYINVVIFDSKSILSGCAHFPYLPESVVLPGVLFSDWYADHLPDAHVHCVAWNRSHMFSRYELLGVIFDYDVFTLAHEMGHYLGLLHPFVDGKGNFGDYCDDTPDYCVNGYETFLSELDETFPYSDDNYRKVIQRVALNGRVFIADNIMDYEFGYLDRFTLEQRKRVRTVLENAWLLPGPKIEVEPRARSGKKAVKPSVPKPVS